MLHQFRRRWKEALNCFGFVRLWLYTVWVTSLTARYAQSMRGSPTPRRHWRLPKLILEIGIHNLYCIYPRTPSFVKCILVIRVISTTSVAPFLTAHAVDRKTKQTNEQNLKNTTFWGSVEQFALSISIKEKGNNSLAWTLRALIPCLCTIRN